MAKRNKIIYWGTTGFLAFGMFAQGITQIAQSKGYVDIILHLGYPIYLLDNFRNLENPGRTILTYCIE